MPIGIAGAAVIGGATIVGSYLQGEAIGDAASANSEATMYAADLEQGRYEQNREDIAPWREAGVKSLSEMDRMLYGDAGEIQDSFRNTPGYQFRLDEGLRALTRSSLSGSVTGNTYRGLVDYGQEYASREFGNRYNRLAGLAGTGQTATQYTGTLGANSAARQGNLAINVAGVNGAAGVGQANVYAGALGQLASAGAGYYGSQGGGSMAGNFYGSGRVAPGGSFGGNDPYAGAGGYGDGWNY